MIAWIGVGWHWLLVPLALAAVAAVLGLWLARDDTRDPAPADAAWAEELERVIVATRVARRAEFTVRWSARRVDRWLAGMPLADTPWVTAGPR